MAIAVEVESKGRGPCWINRDHVVALKVETDATTIVLLAGGHEVRVRKSLAEMARLIGWTAK